MLRFILSSFSAALLCLSAHAQDTTTTGDVIVDMAQSMSASVDADGGLRFDAGEIDLLRAGSTLDLDGLLDGGWLVVEGIAVPDLSGEALAKGGDVFVVLPGLDGEEGESTAQTREHVLLARQVGVPSSTGYLVFEAVAARASEEAVSPRSRETVVVLDVALALSAIVETSAAGETVIWSVEDEATAKRPKFANITLKRGLYGETMASSGIHIPVATGLVGVEPDEID